MKLFSCAEKDFAYFSSKMIYGYIRVSTDKQTTENQRFEINNFCHRQNIEIDKWFDETINGTKEPEKRLLGKLLKKLQKDDILICSELRRLGRSLFMIMDITHARMEYKQEIFQQMPNVIWIIQLLLVHLWALFLSQPFIL